MKKRLLNTRAFRAMYIMAFIFSVGMGVPVFINSSFLGQYASDQVVGLIYVIGSIVTLIVLGIMPTILDKFGNFKTMLTIGVSEVFFLLMLALFQVIWLVIPAFIFYSAFVSLLYFNFDVFLETFSKESSTGRIRATFLTVSNLAILISPLIAGFVLGNGDYGMVYMIAAGFNALLVILLTFYFRDFKDPSYSHLSVWKTLRTVWRNQDIHKIFFANLFLKMFFAWMVIYSPIYLHEVVGFGWEAIGVIFTLMLLPYILFELPAGKLADTKWGEKEIMSAGFVIMGVATFAMPFATQPSFWIWVTILFLTRVGASLVEITSESYFFKHVDGHDTDTISFFRDTRPVAYIIGPFLGSLLLFFVNLHFLFYILGALMLWGVRYSWTLHDTK